MPLPCRQVRRAVPKPTAIWQKAGFEVSAILDEPSSANAVYKIQDGVIVDIGGGTTGLAILKDGKVVQVEDEPTGGTHSFIGACGKLSRYL